MKSSLRNMVLVLGGVGLVAALSLGGVRMATQEAIEASNQAKLVGAVKQVLPPFNNDPVKECKEVDVKGGKLKVYPAQQDGQWVGTAVESFTTSGFGGEITVMVGFDTEGAVYGYNVLAHKETPGLGDRMLDWFKPQVEPEPSLVERIFGFRLPVASRSSCVVGRSLREPLRVSKDGGDIDAITAATISSRAFLDALNRAYLGFDANASPDAHTGATSPATNDDNNTEEQ